MSNYLDIVSRERNRVLFVLNRDGQDEALSFVRRGLKNYRKTVVDGGFASNKEYRAEYILSYLYYKRFLEIYG